MELDQYQREALQTDNTDKNYGLDESRKDIVVALLGIAGELGTLATAYKKRLRDGPAYELYADNVAEELGDLLWYVAVLTEKFGLRLSEVAEKNIKKTRARWGGEVASEPDYDAEFPADQRLPRKFTIKFFEDEREGETRVVLVWDGVEIGNSLTDNARSEDGYRFHDAFHLAFAAVLGWSPVTRKLMGRKRRKDRVVDETEDGGRALVIEEGIAAYIFNYGEAHNDLDGVVNVDFEVLKTVKSMTQRLEVKTRSWNDWERAIVGAYAAFRQLKASRGGFIDCDLDARTMSFRAANRG